MNGDQYQRVRAESDFDPFESTPNNDGVVGVVDATSDTADCGDDGENGSGQDHSQSQLQPQQRRQVSRPKGKGSSPVRLSGWMNRQGGAFQMVQTEENDDDGSDDDGVIESPIVNHSSHGGGIGGCCDRPVWWLVGEWVLETRYGALCRAGGLWSVRLVALVGVSFYERVCFGTQALFVNFY